MCERFDSWRSANPNPTDLAVLGGPLPVYLTVLCLKVSFRFVSTVHIDLFNFLSQIDNLALSFAVSQVRVDGGTTIVALRDLLGKRCDLLLKRLQFVFSPNYFPLDLLDRLFSFGQLAVTVLVVVSDESGRVKIRARPSRSLALTS